MQVGRGRVPAPHNLLRTESLGSVSGPSPDLRGGSPRVGRRREEAPGSAQSSRLGLWPPPRSCAAAGMLARAQPELAVLSETSQGPPLETAVPCFSPSSGREPAERGGGTVGSGQTPMAH